MSVSTRTFVRGEIGEDERFFIIAQSKIDKTLNSDILNYVIVKKSIPSGPQTLRQTSKNKNYVCFSSYHGEQEPLYFTGTMKNLQLNLYWNGKHLVKGVKANNLRKVPPNSIYAGCWYGLSIENDGKTIPVNWYFFQGITSSSKKDLMVGNYMTGYMTLTSSSRLARYPEEEVRYCFLPEYFKDESGLKHKTFDVFMNNFKNGFTVRGFTMSEKSRGWYEYPTNYSGIPIGAPRKGTEIVKKNSRSNYGSFGDLKDEIKTEKKASRSTAPPPQKQPSWSRMFFPQNSGGGGGGDNYFMIGLVCGVILTLVVISLVYILFSHFRNSAKHQDKKTLR